jgi:hypothetical protein
MLTAGEVLLHDNARPHTAVRTPALIDHFNWELFDHPPYSPDPAQRDYNLFTYLKNWFGIIALQQQWGVDVRCQNMAELTRSRLL